MNAKLLEERTVFKVVVPVRVMRICRRSDLHVWPDFGFGRIYQSQPNGFPRRRPFACVRRKPPALLCVHLPFPPVLVLRVLSSRTTRWKSARLHGGTMLQSLSAPLQSGLRFFQHPMPAIPSAFLAGAPAFTRRRNVGFMMLSSSDTNELAPAVHTGSLECPCVPSVQRNNRLRAFWPEPVSIFGSLGLTMLMAVHLCWASHSACPSDRIDARSLGNHLTAFSASPGCQDVVSAASDKTVTSFAGADRLLRTESQVWFTHFISCQTITVTPSFRTHALPLIL